MKASFGSSELIRCLKILGFSPKSQDGTSHVKFEAPSQKESQESRERPFIIVILGRKDFDPHSQSRYINQIFQKTGIAKKEIKKCLTQKKYKKR